nr:IS1 family transposase [Escherichia coli]
MVFLRCSSGSVSISCPSCSATDGVVRNGKSTAGHPLTRRRVCRCSVSVVAHYRELFRPDKRKI